MNYFFVPGRKWLLAQAELKAVLSHVQFRYVELSSNEKLLLFDIMATEEQIMELFFRLGGSVKCGKVIGDPYEFLEEYDFSETHKIKFAISFSESSSGVRALADKRNRLGMEIKKWLRGKGVSARFVSKFSTFETSAVLLTTNRVLEEGFEINRLVHPKTGETVWGSTIALQDYEGFAKRDYDRPRINKKKGMIPPKLARIMVNLAQIPTGGIVWDPFCGSGTILMEALLLGYSVLGTDIDPLAIEETKENLHWTCEQYWISHKNYTVFEHDIHDALPLDVAFDAVVTEPYLGPTLLRKISVEQVNELNSAIKPLFNALGQELDRQIIRNRHGAVVLVVPGFRGHSGWVDMNETFDQHPNIQKKSEERPSMAKPLQWDRPNSIIRRNISQFSF